MGKSVISTAIAKANANASVVISNPCKIQKFKILWRDFSLPTSELTITMKLKRADVCRIWEDEIGEMYGDPVSAARKYKTSHLGASASAFPYKECSDTYNV